VLENARPGGILNDHLCKAWNEANQAMDRNSGHGIFFTGPAPADDDKGGHLLAAAMAGHDSIDMYGAIRSIKFADDALAPGYRAADLAPWSRRAGIEASGAPLFVRVGWLDAATVNGAIERFLSYSNPQLLVIGPWSHGGWHANDPFLEMRRPRSELDAAQARELISFFSSTLREGGGPAPSGKLIRYYTFGEGVWKESATWPVPGFTATRLYFAPEGALSNRRPEGPDGADRYDVDFSATTGESDRWRSNLGGGAVEYPDRAAEDRKLLCYTGPALDRDVEVTGLPVISLQLASSVEDGAVYAYLEDVAPDGTVTYITEGQLRLLHRAVSDKDPPHAVLGPYHSFERGDASRVEPGKPMEVSFAMQATSVLLRKGHRIRIAIAGHDAANFERIPAAGEATYTVERNAILASWIELPMKAR
jgi:putative CocE/NonD family hydrolase